MDITTNRMFTKNKRRIDNGLMNKKEVYILYNKGKLDIKIFESKEKLIECLIYKELLLMDNFRIYCFINKNYIEEIYGSNGGESFLVKNKCFYVKMDVVGGAYILEMDLVTTKNELFLKERIPNYFNK